MPPQWRNHRVPTGGDTPATRAASSLASPRAIAAQNGRRAAGGNTGGRPGDRSFLRVEQRNFRRPVLVMPHLVEEVLRRPIEFTMLSSALMMGLIPPSPEFVAASVAADHTGARDGIADLLQSLDDGREGNRTHEQYAESLRNLRLLLDGKPVEYQARRAIELREARRSQAEAAVMSGQVKDDAGVAFGVVGNEIEAAFFPILLPQSQVIVVACPNPEGRGEWIVKVRLGTAALPGMTLHSLAIGGFDPAFGGRWNAGSTKRGGGTSLSPDAWVEEIRQRVAEYADRAAT